MSPDAWMQRLGMRLPIVQAPMSGPATPELAAAVSNAGGLGSLGVSFMSGPAIKEAAARLRQLTDRPFALNLFHPENHHPSDETLARAQAALKPFAEELGANLPEPSAYLQPFEEQIEAVLEVKPAVFSFCFGIPDEAVLERLRATGCLLVGTATTVSEAELLEEAGVDAIVAQGFEAGGHRASFAVPFDHGLVGLMALLPQVVDAVSLPVIAAGGIMDGRGIAAALTLGASAAQLGTAFLGCPEAAMPELHRTALFAAHDDATALTDAYTGKPARGLRNRFMVEMFERHQPLAPYPAQYGLMQPVRTAAQQQRRLDLLAIWAGQGVGALRRMTASDLMAALEQEMAEAREGRSGSSRHGGA